MHFIVNIQFVIVKIQEKIFSRRTRQYCEIPFFIKNPKDDSLIGCYFIKPLDFCVHFFIWNLSFPQFLARWRTKYCSFKRFEFDFKVGHSKNIFNNYSCSPPTPFLYLLFFSLKSECCRSAREPRRHDSFVKCTSDEMLV